MGTNKAGILHFKSMYARGGVWKEIYKFCEEFKQLTRLEVGNGSKISFWTDLCAGDE